MNNIIIYEKEKQIISNLRNDSRASLASISQNIQMPVSTVHDKIIRMQKDNIITKYALLIDFSKLGYYHQGKIALKVPHQQKEELFSFLKKNQSVNSFYEINGGFDFFVETVHKDIKDYVCFIDSLQECFDILEMHEYQTIKEIEKERFLRD